MHPKTKTPAVDPRQLAHLQKQLHKQHQLFYSAIMNYDFDEAKTLYKQLKSNKKTKKKLKFLIKVAKIKHSFKN